MISGDLAPLAHIALAAMGEGRIFDPKLHRFVAAHTALHSHGLHPVVFGAKDGLSMVNGTQFITGVGSFALEAGIVSAQVQSKY